MTTTAGPSSAVQPKRYVINRLPRTDDELWFTVLALWGYRIPRHKVCDDHVAPFTAFADAYFARSSAAIWKASRGLGGKSRTLAMLGLTEVALLGCEVTVLGGSSAQSINVHEATKEGWGWHASPKHLLTAPPTRFSTTLTHGGHMRTLTASQTSVRGPHPPRLRMDEIDEMDQGILDAALGQPMTQMNYQGIMVPTHTVMSSTHQYPDKAMSTMIGRAKEQGWPVHVWCYRESSNPTSGWLTQEGIHRAKSVVSEFAWNTEFDMQEPSFGGRAIDTDAVDRCFDPNLGTFVGDRMVLAKKLPNRHYITAVDWAKSKDQTIIATFDTTELPWLCVAWQKVNKLPWPMLVARAVEQWRLYGDKFVHDATGVGSAAHDIIREQVTGMEFARVKGVVMGGGRGRDALYTEYIAAIEHDDIRYPRITYAHDEHRYVTPEDLFTSKGHVPDSVVAGSLAWQERSKRPAMAAPGGLVRPVTPWDV